MIKKFKTILFSLLPIIAFVLVMHLFVQKIDTNTFVNFFIGCGILIVGQVIFLIGIEKSIEPMGEFVGGSVQSNNHFFVYIIFGLVFGIFSTIAEPDMQVFAGEVIGAGFNFNKFVFLIVAGVGVGVYISLALIRVATKFSLKLTLLISYAVCFILAIFAGSDALSMSLDTGGNTTGVVTSPFLLALGVGIAGITLGAKRKDEDNFGFIAMSSVGPIIAVLILTIITGRSNGGEVVETSSTPLWLETLKDVSFSIIPLVIVFFIFEAIFIKISKQEKKKLIVGSLITFVGFYLFLFGINYGLSGMGECLGGILRNINNTGIIILICALLGFLIVFSEPTIRILANQIEETTNRNIKSGVVVVAIAVSVMASMVLCVLKVRFGISIWWYVGIIYGLAFLLMAFTPNLFVAIAFDSSGVATGTMTVAFLFPIIMGLSGSSLGGFGMIAILCMTPILVMEILGIAYRVLLSREARKTAKILVSLSRTEDEYSNISKLQKVHDQFVLGER